MGNWQVVNNSWKCDVAPQILLFGVNMSVVLDIPSQAPFCWWVMKTRVGFVKETSWSSLQFPDWCYDIEYVTPRPKCGILRLWCSNTNNFACAPKVKGRCEKKRPSPEGAWHCPFLMRGNTNCMVTYWVSLVSSCMSSRIEISCSQVAGRA